MIIRVKLLLCRHLIFPLKSSSPNLLSGCNRWNAHLPFKCTQSASISGQNRPGHVFVCYRKHHVKLMARGSGRMGEVGIVYTGGKKRVSGVNGNWRMSAAVSALSFFPLSRLSLWVEVCLAHTCHHCRGEVVKTNDFTVGKVNGAYKCHDVYRVLWHLSKLNGDIHQHLVDILWIHYTFIDRCFPVCCNCARFPAATSPACSLQRDLHKILISCLGKFSISSTRIQHHDRKHDFPLWIILVTAKPTAKTAANSEV